jgi:prophage regulatory protein
MAETILRLPDVKARTGLSRTTIHNRVVDGSFPKPIKIGLRAIGWLESDINKWITLQVKRSRNPLYSTARS